MKWLQSIFYAAIQMVQLMLCFKTTGQQRRSNTTFQAPFADPVPCYCKLESVYETSKCFNMETSQVQQPLLPGLPNDLAVACLIRVPRIEHSKLHFVCKGWHNLLTKSYFYSKRESLGLAEEWIYVLKVDHTWKISGYSFDPSYGLWQSLPPVPRQFTGTLGFGCTVLSGCHLYVFGATDPKNVPMRDVIFYCAKTNKWHKAPDMLHKRQDCVYCVIDDRLYVTGSEDEEIPRTPVPTEVYEPKKDAWRFVSNMTTYMAPLKGVVFDGKWFVNGLRGIGNELSSEVLVPETGTWTRVTNELISGLGTSSVFIDGNLYTLDEGKIKVYNATTDSWNILDQEHQLGSYSFATLICLNGKLCAVDKNNISLIDIPSCGERANTNNYTRGSVSRRGNVERPITNLWSNSQGHILGCSNIKYCQVLKI